MLRILSLLGWFVVGRGLAVAEFNGCLKCEEEFCPKSADECYRGLVHDPCGCCPGGVCALAQGEKCFDFNYGNPFPKGGLRKYATCGDYMECIPRTDLAPNDRPENLCVCMHSDPVCGSDNTTYDSLCDMREAKSDLNHYGPCLTKPVIISGPQVTSAYEGNTFAVDCEAKGFPVPSISWEFHSSIGLMATLPGDDSTVIVHSRGGPENYMLTSWLQIESLRKNDSGRYICVAKNSEGEDRSMASVHVSTYSLK